MNRRIFLSQPITGQPRDRVIAINNEMVRIALSMNMQPVNPIKIVPASVFADDSDNAWRNAMMITYQELLTCNSIMIANNWNFSDGCRIEEATARLRNYNIFHRAFVFDANKLVSSYWTSVTKSSKYEIDFFLPKNDCIISVPSVVEPCNS
jgi:hypothetical protein